MVPPTRYAFQRQRIAVASDDTVTTGLILRTLSGDGHCVSLAPGALAGTDLLGRCDLLISSLCVGGIVRLDLLEELQRRWPALPILVLAQEGTVPGEHPSLSVPFSAEELQAAVRPLLSALRGGTVLALENEPHAA